MCYSKYLYTHERDKERTEEKTTASYLSDISHFLINYWHLLQIVIFLSQTMECFVCPNVIKARDDIFSSYRHIPQVI